LVTRSRSGHSVLPLSPGESACSRGPPQSDQSSANVAADAAEADANVAVADAADAADANAANAANADAANAAGFVVAAAVLVMRPHSLPCGLCHHCH
jgi:Pyruvate/2-oxoacid:ferredoxin oxidoreductase gamma subunit